MAFPFQQVFFPGIVFHELSHYLACVLVGVNVKEVKLFDPEEAFVRHGIPRAWQSPIISIAPFVIGTILGLELLVFAAQSFARMLPVSILFYWLGFSIILFSFPSKVDAMNTFNIVTASLKKRIVHGSIASRFLWLLVSPLIFFPIVFLSGFFLLFDASSILRFAWTIFLFVLSINSGFLSGTLAVLDSLLRGFFQWLFG
ncbi:MAG: M50 family metallopeptidase [Candidatus ainarchaeum sp.]|nr:M50 family metallopeptidase [Candidatus ainarchaeum sp.]